MDDAFFQYLETAYNLKSFRGLGARSRLLWMLLDYVKLMEGIKVNRHTGKFAVCYRFDGNSIMHSISTIYGHNAQYIYSILQDIQSRGYEVSDVQME